MPENSPVAGSNFVTVVGFSKLWPLHQPVLQCVTVSDHEPSGTAFLGGAAEATATTARRHSTPSGSRSFTA
jgi:hypothetical protein